MLALGIGVMTSAAMAGEWVGGDDQPTNPLGCDGSTPAAAALPYDGASPTNPPDRKGKPITIIDVPKIIGVPYFTAATKGMAEAAAELGNVSAKTDGPTQAIIDQQITFIDNYITSGVDGILYSALDAVAIAPVLKKALDAGILVVGYDGASTNDSRQWFVSQAEYNGVARALVEQMVGEIGEDGAFAILTNHFNSPGQGRWIAEMEAYAAKCHPNLKYLESVAGQDDNTMSATLTTQLMTKYGDEMKGVFGMTSTAYPAAAEAVTQAGKCGQVALVGLATPNPMKPYVKSGCVKAVVLWNPVDLGYAAVQVMRGVADGTLVPGATSFKAGRLGELKVVNGSDILLGPPFIFTPENIDQFDF
jgi:rhamnose transport system substrate-binding protein